MLPAASLGYRVMVTNVLTSPLPARQAQMIQRSVSSGSYEAPQLFAPREANSVLGDIVGMLMFAEIANYIDRRASKLRRPTGGAAPGAGESHFVFPPDCLECSRLDDAFDVRGKVSNDEREDVCVE